MKLFETLKKSFLKKPEIEIDKKIAGKIDITLSDDYYEKTLTSGFFDKGSDFFIFSRKKYSFDELINEQARLIENYRKTSENPYVSNALEEIINEFLFVSSKNDSLTVVFDDSTEIPKQIKEKISDALKISLNLLNFESSGVTLIQTWLVDGQINFYLNYDKSGKNITSVSILDPRYLYFDGNDDRWKYKNDYYRRFYFSKQKDEISISREEIIKIDSGKYKDGLILSILHNVIKIANQIETLEDMLIPMRLSRSISRRVFKVDISGLSAAKGQQVMNEIQRKYKYDRVYDVNTGTISFRSSTHPLVEDYWMPHRDGKGIDVQQLDESGNLGEIGDIEHFLKKLYKAMKVPLGRMGFENSPDFDFSGMNISREEINFFSYINRLRKQFNKTFIELMKRILIANNTMTEEDFKEISKSFKLVYNKENTFLERLTNEHLRNSLELYNEIKDLIGVEFSRQYVRKNVLKLSDIEIENMKKEIEKEKLEEISKEEKEEDDE